MAASLFSSSYLERCAGSTGAKQGLYEQKCPCEDEIKCNLNVKKKKKSNAYKLSRSIKTANASAQLFGC